MHDSEITIFYSWQSDLPGSETRNLIQEGIKDAVKLLRDTVDIEADRDTQGEFGSPDIAQTIFSKIDNCDIFIADVSAVCRYETTDKDGNVKVKLMPNPNVMLELGYATHVVGWENVICILNSDYGAPDNMPFDIANRRLTTFSLSDGKSKGDVRRYIKGIIQETVENILENGKRVKTGFSNLNVGCYSGGSVSNKVLPYCISDSSKFQNFKEKTMKECQEILCELREIHLPIVECEEVEVKPSEKVTEGTIMKDGTVLTPVNPNLQLDLFKSHRVVIHEDDKKAICELVNQYLGENIDIEEDFFSVGNLKKRNTFGISPSYEYEGSIDEQNKYDKLMMLEYSLHQLKLWDWYATTFDGYILIPLAIENRSTITDEDIDIFIKVETENVEIILPSEKLINPDMIGLEGLIYEEDILKSLLMMSETADIEYDFDISYSIEDTQADMRARLSAAGINGNPRYDSNDYKRELLKYIALPIEDSKSEFSFQIKNLRAKEKKWLGAALLLKPLSDSFDIIYSIKSKRSDGGLCGTIKYEK